MVENVGEITNNLFHSLLKRTDSFSVFKKKKKKRDYLIKCLCAVYCYAY